MLYNYKLSHVFFFNIHFLIFLLLQSICRQILWKLFQKHRLMGKLILLFKYITKYFTFILTFYLDFAIFSFFFLSSSFKHFLRSDIYLYIFFLSHFPTCYSGIFWYFTSDKRKYGFSLPLGGLNTFSFNFLILKKKKIIFTFSFWFLKF